MPRQTGKTTKAVNLLISDSGLALIVRSLDEKNRIVRTFQLKPKVANRIFPQTHRGLDLRANRIRGSELKLIRDSPDTSAYPLHKTMAIKSKIKTFKSLSGTGYDW